MLKTLTAVAIFALAPLHGAVLGSNYDFTYGYLRDSHEDSLYIDGPSGREIHGIGYHVDVYGTPVINQYGELALFIEASDDPAVLFAVYGLSTRSGGNGLGVINGSGTPMTINSSFGYLDLPSLPGVPYYSMKASPISISDSGLVTAKVIPTFLGGAIPPPNSTAVWQLPNLKRAVMTEALSGDLGTSAVVPEPGTLPLAGLGVLALLFSAARRSLR